MLVVQHAVPEGKMMQCKSGKCRNKLSPREEKLNAGLCDSCFEKALRATARDIAKRIK
jgi:hypothetical protein